MRQHDLALAPARPASKAAESLCTGRAHYGGVRRRTTTYFFSFRRPRTSGARYDGASFFFEDLARAGRATTAHLFFYDPRSSEGGNELDAQSPTTPHPHAHVCYSTASSTTTQSNEPRSSTFRLFISSTKAIRILCCGGEPQASATAMPTNNSRLKTRRKESIVSSPRWGIILARPGPPRDVRTTTSFLNTEPYRL